MILLDFITTGNNMFDNEIVGDRLNNNLIGTQEKDRILGLQGNDFLVGKQENDILAGGRGENVLNGANPNSRNPGTGEIDILSGAKDGDTFVLGDAANIYYSELGINDYAVIKNFDIYDTIQLKGNATDYFLREDLVVKGSSGTAIIAEENEELIGFIRKGENLDLNSDRFSYIESPDFDKMYVFSDSLADPGNIYKTTQSVQLIDDIFGLDIPVTPASSPYFEGRFSNGLVWVERLAAELDIELIPSTDLSVIFPGLNINSPLSFSDGFGLEVNPKFDGRTTEESVNFAFGGAQTGEKGAGEYGDLIPGIQQQVEWFIEDRQIAEKTADPDALYIISGGRNDYSDDNPNSENVVNNIEEEIESLYDIGARDFLVSNLSDLGKLPATPEMLADTFSGYTATHNELLEQTIDELNDTLTGANIVILDFDALFDNILENPSDYDLTNVTEPYLDPITLEPTVGADVDEYLFYDTVHPTAAVHEIVNDFTLNTLAVEF